MVLFEERGSYTLPMLEEREQETALTPPCKSASYQPREPPDLPNHGSIPPIVNACRSSIHRNGSIEGFCVFPNNTHPKTTLAFMLSICILSSAFMLPFSVDLKKSKPPDPFGVLMASSGEQPLFAGYQKEYDQIPRDEEEMVNIQRPAEHLDVELNKRMLVGKILAPRTLDRTEVKDAILQLWEDSADFTIIEGPGNIYSFTFKTQTEAEQILEQSPWFVLNHLMSLQEWGEAETADQVSFDFVPFWIQIHGLPSKLLNLTTLSVIVKNVGGVIEIEDPFFEGSFIRLFGRAKVKIDVKKPLWAGRWIETAVDRKIWVTFKYENLQNLCYKCGVVGHDKKYCTNATVLASFDKTKPKFGPFLTTYPPKPLGMLILERMAFKVKPMVKEVKEDDNGSKGIQRGPVVDQMNEGQRRSELNRGIEQGIGGVERRSSPAEWAQAKQHQQVGLLRGGHDQGEQADVDKVVGTTGFIDLTGESDHELEVQLLGKQDQTMVTRSHLEQGGSSKARYFNVSTGTITDFCVKHPEEGATKQGKTQVNNLNLATERDLLLTWNDRCALKRGSGEFEDIEEVEQELFKRDRKKKEEWYDEEGNLLMVKVSTLYGSQSYMIDEWGELTPPSK